MLGFLLFNLYAFALSLLASLQKSKQYLLLCLLSIFVFLAIRNDYGTDLPTYRRLFYSISNNSFIDTIEKYQLQFEIGFLLLNKILKPFGFNTLLALCAAFHIGAFYIVTIRVVPRNLYFLSIFILVFNPDLLLTQSSAIRQTLAMSIFLISIDSLYKRNLSSYIITCLLASSFHYSALILIPFYFFLTPNFLGYFKGIILLLMYISFVFAGRIIIRRPIEFLLASTNSKYLSFLYSNIFGVFEFASGIKIIVSILLIFFLIFNGKYLVGYQAIAIKGALLSFITLSLGFSIPMAGRLSMYFTPFVAFAFPSSLNQIKKKEIVYIFILLYLLFISALCYQFFTDPGWTQSFKQYKTIFSPNE